MREAGEGAIRLRERTGLRQPYPLRGISGGNRRTNVPALATAFGLPAVPEEHETANSLDSPARLNHTGIRVCGGDSCRVSPDWHQVAVLAAVTELWRCVSGTNEFHRAP